MTRRQRNIGMVDAEGAPTGVARTESDLSTDVTLDQWLGELSACEQTPTEAFHGGLAIYQTPDLLRLFALPVSAACQQLRDSLHAIENGGVFLPGSVTVIEAELLKHLHSRLKQISERTLALEMQVAALRGELQGDSPAARFDSFTARLQCPQAVWSILHEYPILAQQALYCINQWVRSSLEFMRHLAADWRLLQETFGFANEVGDLVELKGDAGDRHSDGKAVIILRFATGFRLVYKPRSLAVDQRFQELLGWCNARGASPRLRTLRVVDQGDHGWVEFVEARSCRSLREIRRFYQRQGLYLSLLYVLQATDFHFENLIAAGEHPVLVDLETLFHERLPGTVSSPAIRGMSNSVVSIGILPRVSYYEGFDKGVDFSGLGALTGQEIEVPTYEFQASGTDEMRLIRVEMHTLAGKHRPTLAGADVTPADFRGELIGGFTRMYRLLRRHRADLAAEDGPLAAFADVETRFIARATQIYGLLLEQSFHPDFLRSRAARSAWFDQLWSQANDAAGLRPLIAAERAELERNDIPLFHLRPGSRDLWSSSGQRFANYFPRTPLETVCERVAALGPQDFARQRWLLCAAVAKLEPTAPALPQRPITNFKLLQCATTNPEAFALGERLCKLAWQNDDEAGWLAIRQSGHGWFVDAVGLEEGGLIEIARYLANLDQRTQASRYVDLVTKTLRGINLLLLDEVKDHGSSLPARVATLARSLDGYGDAKLAVESSRLTRLLGGVGRLLSPNPAVA
ncbi:MAG: type 2 lantipeptide synthetase LanM [Planctomycetaceae bacterium]|nr:type 2 lantipeptide synthetase LanM [Planctomycetaceae bacterium]